jgi:predicted nucleic acid-binding Zn ribbon protein
VTVQVDNDDSSHPLSYWDAGSQSWQVAPGEYTVYVGNSSAEASLTVAGTFQVERASRLWPDWGGRMASFRMDRAGNVMRKLNLQGHGVSAPELARAAWPQAVGKRIAAHARAVEWFEGCLVVEVEDSVWLQHLRSMTGHILSRVQQITGREAVRQLEFRPGVPRREPQRSERARSAADEAEGIRDPVLKRLYKASRSRSA